ncbi:MAG: cell division protein FtsZ [Thiomonas sp.]|nr:cell division protein FtsZ [Thiomonas sp.]
MGQLQTALIVIGAIIIAAVVAYNTWQSSKFKRQRATASDDVQTAIEPAGLDTLPTDPDGQTFEPLTLGPDVGPRPRLVPLQIDPLIDAIASYLLDPVRPGDVLLPRLPKTARAGAKRMLFEGRHAETGKWEPLQAQGVYAELQAAVQLSNRAGPINAIEFSEFIAKCHELGDALGVAPDLPDMTEALEQARGLDAFANDNDAQLSITLRARSVPWGMDFLRQRAQAAGFVPGTEAGRMVLLYQDVEQAPTALVHLQFDARADLSDSAAAVGHATLLLEVPQAPAAQRPFARMRQVARELATALDAAVVDDNNAPLSDAALDHIEKQLDMLYEVLDQRGLPAGSAAAQRLFS